MGLIIQGNSVHNLQKHSHLRLFFSCTQSVLQMCISPPNRQPSVHPAFLLVGKASWPKSSWLEEPSPYSRGSTASWLAQALLLGAQGKAASKKWKRRSEERGETARENRKPACVCAAFHRSCGC